MSQEKVGQHWTKALTLTESCSERFIVSFPHSMVTRFLMRVVFVLSFLSTAIASSRVRRQWGPADFYQFEQWVNYINRPRQEFSGDAPGYHTGGWGTLERTIQPHSAPPGWRLDQGSQMRVAFPHGGYGGYGFPMRPHPTVRPPLVIDTSVFRTNDNSGYFPGGSGYVMPPDVNGPMNREVTTTTAQTTTTTTTTTTVPTTTTEDERERFIQTAVKEDMDKMQEKISTTESEIALTSTETPESTTELATTEALTSTLEVSTSSNVDGNTSGEFPTETTTSDSTSGFSSADYNAVWSEEGQSTLSTVPAFATGVPEGEEEESSKTGREMSSTFVATMEELTTSSAIPLSEGSTTQEISTQQTEMGTLNTENSSGTTDTPNEQTTTGSAFLTDLLSGLRAPPLPMDVSKKLQELGVAIDKP